MSEPVGTSNRTTAEGGEQRFVTLGRISGAHGIQGWVRVHSETSPRENIVNYSPWYLEQSGRHERRKVNAGRMQGKGVVAKLAGCNDRDAAEALVKAGADGVKGDQVAARGFPPLIQPFSQQQLAAIDDGMVDGGDHTADNAPKDHPPGSPPASSSGRYSRTSSTKPTIASSTGTNHGSHASAASRLATQ